jgi:hypothetical protein
VDVLLIGAEQEWGLNDRATVQRPREWRRGMVERRLSLGEGGIAALDRRFERASGSFGARAPDTRMVRARAGRSSRLGLHSPARVQNACRNGCHHRVFTRKGAVSWLNRFPQRLRS